MKTRRSRKSFEIIPPTRKSRKMTKRRKALNVVNETIVLSDSENEEGQIDNDDIQVIDVAEASQTIVNPEEEEETVSCPIVNADRLETTVTVPSPKLKPLIVASAAEDPPVIDIDDEPDPDDDDDGIEVVGIVLAGRRTSRTKEKRASLNRRSSGSNSSLAMGLVSKAKNVLRRSASNSSNNTGLGQRQHYNLNKLSSKSKKIGRNKKWKNNKFQMRDGNFRGKQRNALMHNRSREYNRQVIFRPDNNQAPTYIPFNQGNFSFENNPFAPCSTSTPAFSRHNERSGWIQKKRGGPDPIAPGSNIMNAGQSVTRAPGTLRPIVIDGSNVAVGHGGLLPGGGNRFSARGIRICVDYFKKRGHKEILVFVPRFRLKKSECRDPELLEEMEKEGHVRFTPSREAGGQRIASYDDLGPIIESYFDLVERHAFYIWHLTCFVGKLERGTEPIECMCHRFVVQYADETGGIIISNDNFRDLYEKKPHLQETIKFRILQYTWITQDVIMFPEDPMGRIGPSLDQFLCF